MAQVSMCAEPPSILITVMEPSAATRVVSRSQQLIFLPPPLTPRGVVSKYMRKTNITRSGSTDNRIFVWWLDGRAILAH